MTKLELLHLLRTLSAVESTMLCKVEQKPIAWANINKQGDITHTSNKKTAWAKTPLYTKPHVEQEPVAWVAPNFGFLFPDREAALRYLENIESHDAPWPIYTHPQPKREPLTDEQIKDIWRGSSHMDVIAVARAIERAHGIGGEE
ncbi:MAG: hypothetical protein ACRCTG_16770 [Aestuariivirga sp.]